MHESVESENFGELRFTRGSARINKITAVFSRVFGSQLLYDPFDYFNFRNMEIFDMEILVRSS